MTQATSNTKVNASGKLYPAGFFFMQLKLGLWTQGLVESIGIASLFKEYPSQKSMYSHYRELLSSPLRLGTDIFLCSIKILCKNNVWDFSSVAIAVFRVVPLESGEQKEIAVKISESETLPFSNLIKRYKPKDEHPVIEMEDKTVTYSGNAHAVSINPVLPLQYLSLETKQTSAEAPADAGEYIVSPVGKNDIGAKLTIKKATQKICFDNIADKIYGDAVFNLAASSDSGLNVDFETTDTDVVQIEGSSLKILKAGKAVINACQAGNKNYLPAQTVNSFSIEKAEQQIVSFDKIKNKYIKNTPFELLAVSSSGLPVEFETSDSGFIHIEGNRLTIKQAGKVTITVVQKGDDRYKAADNTISRTFVIEKGLLAWIKKLFRKQ